MTSVARLQGPKAPPPAEARAAAAAAMPAELFRIVGVSFDGRQELLTAIGKGALTNLSARRQLDAVQLAAASRSWQGPTQQPAQLDLLAKRPPVQSDTWRRKLHDHAEHHLQRRSCMP